MKILKKLMKPFHRKIKTPEEYEASMKLFSALMDKGDLCPYIGSEQLISAIMNGAKKLSKSMMVKLHEGLGIPYENMMEVPDASRYRKVAMF